METTTQSLFIPLSAKHVKLLTAEVKETLAVHLAIRDKRFNASQLWAIHRNMKSFGIRKHLI